MTDAREIIAGEMWSFATSGLEDWESLDEADRPVALEGADAILAALDAAGYTVTPGDEK